MTIALLPHRASAISRLTRVRSAIRETVATLPARKAAQPAVNAGRWATHPGEYAGAWACPLDERLPAITAPGITAPIACGNSGAVILHLAGAWSGRVAFEGSADGVTWSSLTLTCLTGDRAAEETDRPGLWRTSPDPQITYLRLHVVHLSHGAIHASVAALPARPSATRSLDPAA